MPKGRGSNKKGQGPTAPKQRPQQVPQGIPPVVENMVLKSQVEDLVLRNRQLQAAVQQAQQIAMAVLHTKRDKTAKITQSILEKLPEYAGLRVDQGDDDTLVVSLVTQEDADAADTD